MSPGSQFTAISVTSTEVYHMLRPTCSSKSVSGVDVVMSVRLFAGGHNNYQDLGTLSLEMDIICLTVIFEGRPVYGPQVISVNYSWYGQHFIEKECDALCFKPLHSVIFESVPAHRRNGATPSGKNPNNNGTGQYLFKLV